MKLQLDQQADFSADSVDPSAASDMETDNGYYHAPEPIHTSSTVAPTKRTVHIPPFIILAVVIILLALALTLIPWHKKSSLGLYLPEQCPGHPDQPGCYPVRKSGLRIQIKYSKSGSHRL